MSNSRKKRRLRAHSLKEKNSSRTYILSRKERAGLLVCDDRIRNSEGVTLQRVELKVLRTYACPFENPEAGHTAMVHKDMIATLHDCLESLDRDAPILPGILEVNRDI